MTINYISFITELNQQFSKMPKLITEDLIRQWFIDTQSLTYSETIIEKPYKLLSINKKSSVVINNRARADLYYQEHGKEDVVVEFKYHKKIDTSTTCKTTNLGEVLRDLNRLSCLNNKEKYFIYVFDKEMKDYYDNAYTKYKDLEFLSINNANGKYHIGANLDIAKLPKNVQDVAFSPFSKSYKKFANFDYDINVNPVNIPTTDYYLIVIKVL